MIYKKNIFSQKPTIALTDQIMAADLLRSGELENRLSAHLIQVPPNAEYPPHEHPSEHVILVLEGDGYARY